jgi:hypothetical protein
MKTDLAETKGLNFFIKNYKNLQKSQLLLVNHELKMDFNKEHY